MIKKSGASRWACTGVGLLLICVAVAGCKQSKPTTYELREIEEEGPAFDFSPAPEANAPRPDGAKPLLPVIALTQVQQDVGLVHTYENGASGQALFVETIGGGGGWLDYDNDGWVDAYLNQGGDPKTEDRDGQPFDQLFRNLGGEAFSSVADMARIKESHYSQGVSVADFNNDGFADVYVTNVGRNTLWQNCGDGTFIEVSAAAGLDDSLWSVSAAWSDLDNDGDLDVYVTNYCAYDPLNPVECLDRQGRPTICNPANLQPQKDHCFLNSGDGSFVESSQVLGLYGPDNRSLGVAIADFSGDSRPDIYVANDTTDNFLFIQQEDGSFSDEARLRGAATDRTGMPQSSMGLAVADFDNNGLLDIYSTHFEGESNTLYANFGDNGFQDVTALGGLHGPTLPYLGFGTVFCDLNLDGRLELVVANGHIDHSERGGDPKMRAQIFAYDGSRQWLELPQEVCDYLSEPRLGRAVAKADYDRDGDVDLLFVNESDPTVLLRNDSPHENMAWLKLQLVGRESNRDGVGCSATVVVGNAERSQVLVAGGSYAAAQEAALTFAFEVEKSGEIPLAKVEIVWPNGKQQSVTAKLNEVLVVQEPL